MNAISDPDIIALFAEATESDPAAFTLETRLEDCDTWDSLAILNLIVLLRDSCDSVVSPDRIADCKTIADLQALVNEGG